MNFRKPFFSIGLILFTLLSTPLFVHLWKCNGTIKKIKNSCSSKLSSIPEFELCTLGDMSSQDLVETVCDNECFDLYGPSDRFLFRKRKLCNHNSRQCRRQ